ncbi:MAG: dolichyl-phosphate mannose synthase [Alteromonadaceae bacterium]|nr:dolichyl-phosphate mannose synthase [Alteromonadaceae bacterium]
MQETVLVSVIVPVWNDLQRIGTCIDALKKQQFSYGQFEIIVVDNGSTDGTYDLIKTVSNIVPLQEVKPGSYAARNCGLSVAKGEYVAFTDSDCVPDTMWLGKLYESAKKQKNFGVVAGDVVFFSPATSRIEQSALDFENMFSMNQKHNSENGVSITANWLSKMETILHFGMFDSNLKSGGDHALSKKMSQQGFPVIFSKNAVVKHPARNIAEIVSKRKRVIGGSWQRQVGRFKGVAIMYASIKLLIKRCLITLSNRPLPVQRKFKLIGLLFRIFTTSMKEVCRLMSGANPSRQ